MAEEYEIEEGEIYDDSHIDVKIQSVLGDFMKDFEGGVSVENLGPKFGVYGSFLSSHRPSALLLSQPTTTQKSQNPKDLHIDRVEVSGDEPPVCPFVIKGDWIRCRQCWKWRLLPYGTKPEQLSESWLCSMLDWLPGMNCCDISEEDTTRALHALYQTLIQSNFQNRGDVKAHNGKKRKSREQDYLVTTQCNGNDLGETDANAFERRFRKQKKSKVFQTEKRESSTSKGEEKSRKRGTVEREHKTNKYRVEQQSRGMSRKTICKVPFKKALGYGKVARSCIGI